MKLFNLFFGATCLLFAFNVNAADVIIYYSPSCPHCHHAKDFIENKLIYEFDTINVTEVNVMDIANRQDFIDAVNKCGYKTGGVPVIVIGEKCFQGYADSMQDDLRKAVSIDLSSEQKQKAEFNKKELEKNTENFLKNNSSRKNAIVYKTLTDDKKKQNNNIVNYALFGLILLSIVGLFLLFFKKHD